MFFDTHRFAVYSGFLGDRIRLPGLPLSHYGRIRDVIVQEGDVQVRCVCFTVEEVNNAAFHTASKPSNSNARPNNLRRCVALGIVPEPVFVANGSQPPASPAPSRVYLYPEAEAIYTAFRAAYDKGTFFHKARFAKEHADMLQAIVAARAEATETT